ncbi:MAG: GtrA family protein [Chloroflexi bacterium]|nr:GtrA family protein [Chloroflexota bacterium]
MILVKDARERKRFLKFAVVGAIGFGVDFLVFNLVRNLIGLAPVPANVVSFLAAVTSNFVLNRYWTFPDSRSKPLARQLAQYTLVNAAGLGIRTAIFAVIHTPYVALFDHLPLPFLPEHFLGENLALATVVIIVMFWNFFVNRYWTYNDVGASQPTGDTPRPKSKTAS